MKVIDRAYVEAHKDEIIEAMRSGKIFIYPTDTIYGLGCNALLPEAVKKIREIKNRDANPFSVIAPSKDWILENCEVKIENLDPYLPGPYTLIVKTRNQNLPKEVNPTGDETLGVRIPKHWFSELVGEAGIPFITTSVNISGEPHMEKLEDINPDILKDVGYVVYEGEKKGKRSEKVILT